MAVQIDLDFINFLLKTEEGLQVPEYTDTKILGDYEGDEPCFEALLGDKKIYEQVYSNKIQEQIQDQYNKKYQKIYDKLKEGKQEI